MAKWLPIESNPSVMNKYLSDIGVPETWQVMDVLGLDPDLLAMIPREVAAFILLYPLTEKAKEFNDNQDSEVKAVGQDLSKNIFYFKQCVSNACGTVALVHSVANNMKALKLQDGIFKQFVNDNDSKSPEEIGDNFQNHEFLASIHDKLALKGQTAPPKRDAKINKHFIALVNVDGCLYELDGRKSFPINHGNTNEDSFVMDCARVCKEFMSRDPTEANFAIVALVKDN